MEEYCGILVQYKSALGVVLVAHAFNPSTQKADTGQQIPGQPGLHRETMSQNTRKKTNKLQIQKLKT